MSVKRQSVSPPVRRKDGRGRPSTPFLRERILQSADGTLRRPGIRSRLDRRSRRARRGRQRQRLPPIQIEGRTLRCGRYRRLHGTPARDSRGASRMHLDARSDRDDRSSHFQIFLDSPPVLRVAARPQGLAAIAGASISRSAQRFVAAVKRVFDDGVRRGAIKPGFDARIAAESLLGMIRGINRYGREYTTPDRAVDIVTSIFLDGYAAR